MPDWPFSNGIFVSTYAVIAIGKLPSFYLDRAGAALLGASLMAATGLRLNFGDRPGPRYPCRYDEC